MVGFTYMLSLEIKTGTFTLTKTAGNDPKRFEAFMNFQFTHKVNGNDIDHTLHLHGKIDKPEDWLPAVTNSITGDTGWTVTASGPNHPNGCTGEGEVGNDPIAWTGTVTRV